MTKERFTAEELRVNVKIKLAAMWTSVMFCYLYGDYFELYVPEKVEGLISGENILDSPMKLLAATILLTVPALMISLSILVTSKINRFLNLVFGIFFTVLMLVIAFTSIEEWRMFYVFLAITESIITSSIVWYAWKWNN